MLAAYALKYWQEGSRGVGEGKSFRIAKETCLFKGVCIKELSASEHQTLLGTYNYRTNRIKTPSLLIYLSYSNLRSHFAYSKPCTGFPQGPGFSIACKGTRGVGKQLKGLKSPNTECSRSLCPILHKVNYGFG